MSAIPPEFIDALRMEGIVLDQFKLADLWRRLIDENHGATFITLERHGEIVEDVEDEMSDRIADETRTKIEAAMTVQLEAITAALAPFAELSVIKLGDLSMTNPVFRADLIARHVDRLATNYAFNQSTTEDDT